MRNTGACPGDEVVQLFCGTSSSVTRPTKELRGFERDAGAGRDQTVTFVIRPNVADRPRMQRVVEPGRFDVMVGTSSVTLLTATLDVVER